MKKRKPLSEMTDDEKNGFFATTKEAFAPLQNFISGYHSFVEPCAGAGDLVELLEAFGLDCLGACDISPKQEWITGADGCFFVENFDEIYATCGVNFADVDLIITNPPFSRHHTKTLHRMIDVFSKAKPTWLLLPLGKAANVNFAPFMAYCHEVVTIGRIKWFEGTKDKESRDFAWFHFDQNREFTGTNFTAFRKIDQ